MISDCVLNAEVKTMTTDVINITTIDNDNNSDSKAAEDVSSRNISEVLEENIDDNFRKYILIFYI